jgi:hypothetical protein
MSKLKISHVNGYEVAQPPPGYLTSTSTSTSTTAPTGCFNISWIEVPASKTLIVDGTGFSPASKTDHVCCTLTRLGKSAKEKSESIMVESRFVTKESRPGSGVWTVHFDVSEAAAYLISCHCFQKGKPRIDDAYIEVTVDRTHGDGGGHDNRCSFGNNPPPSFAPNAITANGYCLYPFNDNQNLICTITPMDCTTGATGKGTVAALNTWDAGDNTHWYVAFAPAAGQFSGCYLLTVTAVEGPVSTSGQV